MLTRAGSVVVFLAVLAFPFFYNLVSTGYSSSATAQPQLKIAKPGKCVEDTAWMRKNHMKMLIHVREKAVREGVRSVDHSFHGCINCHPKREEFCNRCHDYVGVKPECWNCHHYDL